MGKDGGLSYSLTCILQSLINIVIRLFLSYAKSFGYRIKSYLGICFYFKLSISKKVYKTNSFREYDFLQLYIMADMSLKVSQL